MSIPKSFTYVVIPVDGAPTQHTHAQVTLEQDHFITHVKSLFANSESSVDSDLLRKQVEANAKQSVSDAFMSSVLGSVSVDIVSLALPVKENAFKAVSLYCDDKGIAKKFPVNKTANALAEACGLTNQNFLGDVVISRIFDDNETEWYRTDFTLQDIQLVADWIQTNRLLNARKKSATSLSSLTQQIAQPASVEMKDLRGNVLTWRDNESDVEVVFNATGCSKKDIKVVVKTDSVTLEFRGERVFSGKLHARVTPDESVWVLQDDRVVLTLEKQVSSAWSQLIA